MKTHYDVLGVPPTADHETVKAAYRTIVKDFHPDLHRGDAAAELRSKQINTAYAVLKDPEGRGRYDEQLRHRRGRVRLLVITALVSAGLVSSGTLFLLNFLLQPEGRAPMTRFTGSATEQVALAVDAVPVAPPPGRTPPASETAWLAIAENGSAEDVLAFIQEHMGTPQAALAQKRLEHLIDAIDDLARLRALTAKTTGSIADRVLGRLVQLAAAKEIVTGALPEPAGEAPSSKADPATEIAASKRPPEAERAVPPHAAPPYADGARLASLDPQSALHPALSLMSGGQYVMATPIPRDAAPIAPGDTKFYVYRAGVWAERGELDRALADYDAAILLDAANIAAFHGRGLLRWRRGEAELALADFDQAIRLSFSDPKIYLDRGVIWYERGRYDRAIADFNRAIKLAPHLASAYSYRGTALRRKREFQSAIADLDHAIRLDPAIAEAYRNRDLARTQRDDPVEALAETPR